MVRQELTTIFARQPGLRYRGPLSSALTRPAAPGGVRRSELLSILQDLICAESPSGREGKAIERIMEIMDKMGFHVSTQRVGTRMNVLTSDCAESPMVLLCSHIDTVPRAKSKAGRMTITDGLVRGPGACDAKGSIAAMLLAYRDLIAKPQCIGKIGLALFVGEETNGDGGLAFVQSISKPRFAIVGEPTSLEVPWAQAGYMEVRLVARGKPTHAFARHEKSAMDCLIDSIHKVRAVIDAMGKGVPDVERPYVFMQRLRGGSNDRFWYLRHECDATFNINIHPSWKAEAVISEIQAVVDEENHGSRASTIELEVLDWDPGVEFSSAELLDAVHSALTECGLKAAKSYMRSWTDAATLESKGIRTIVLGPGALDVAHSPDEFVSIAEVETAVDIYISVAERLASRTNEQ